MNSYPPPPSYSQVNNANNAFNQPQPQMGYGGVPQANMYGGMMPPQSNMYGAYPAGYPMQPMNYEQMMNYRHQLIQQRNAYQMKQLTENYPIKYVVVHAIILISLALAAIGIQIAMIIYQTELYYVGR